MTDLSSDAVFRRLSQDQAVSNCPDILYQKQGEVCQVDVDYLFDDEIWSSLPKLRMIRRAPVPTLLFLKHLFIMW
jgi:hypothetical protein